MAKAKKDGAKRSVIIRALSRFSDKLARCAENSLLAKILCGYFAVEKKADASLTSALSRKRGLLTDVLSQLQDGICRFFTSNKLKNKFTGFLTDLLYLRTRDIGIYLLSTGLYAVIEYYIIKYAVYDFELDVSVLYGSIGVMILSLFFFSGKALANTLYKNPVLSFAAYDLLGADRSRLIPGEIRIRNASVALLAGMVSGALAFIFPPHRIVLFMLCVIVLCVVFFMPESGAVLTVTLIPFLPLQQLLTLCFVSIVSYLLKLIRKKRELRFGPVDAAVMLLAVLTLFGKIVTVRDAGGTDSLYLLGIMAYFLCRNLLGRRQWLDRAMNAAALSSAAVSLFGVFFRFCGTPEQMIAAKSLFAGAGGELSVFFNSSAVFACYVMLTSPLLLYFALCKKRGKVAYIISYAVSFASLVLTGRVYAVIAFIVITVTVLAVYSRHTLVFTVLSVPVVALAAVFMPKSWYLFIFEKIYTENAVIQNVWDGVFRMIGRSFMGGYGIGSFNSVYPQYAAEGYASQTGAKSVYFQLTAEGGIMMSVVFSVCLILFITYCATAIIKCGDRSGRNYIFAPLTAVLCAAFYGVTENIFCSEVVCILLFAVMGCGVAASEISRREYDYELDALNYGQV